MWYSCKVQKIGFDSLTGLFNEEVINYNRKKVNMDTNFFHKGINVLSTNEAIRKRPTMYVDDIKDSKTLTKLIIEAMCLSRARVANGDATQIYIDISNEVTISDNGHGISMEPHGRYTLLEVLLTQLHACKNIKHDDVKVFCNSGIVVVNALSEHFCATNLCSDFTYTMRYRYGDLIASDKKEDIHSGEGLIFNFKFDPIIFGELKIDKEDLTVAIEKIRSTTSASINLTFMD